MELNFEAISKKNFKFTWNDPMHTTEVEISVPNVSALKHSVWADWGPMYTFELTEFESVRIKYNDSVFDSTQKKLRIESPMLAAERECYPFFLIVEDSVKNLNFHLYLDTDYDLGKVEVIRGKDRVKLFKISGNFYLQAVV